MFPSYFTFSYYVAIARCFVDFNQVAEFLKYLYVYVWKYRIVRIEWLSSNTLRNTVQLNLNQSR